MASGITVRWALAEGKLVEKLSAGTEAACLVCSATLSYRAAHKRKRNGISHDVVGHFMHTLGVGGGCSGESVQHAAAKAAAVEMLRARALTFSVSHICDPEHRVECDVAPDGSVASEEVAFTTEGRHFRLDVGLVTGGSVTGAVEILRSHAVGPEKGAALTLGGLAWVEVQADRVLRAHTLWRGGGGPVELRAVQSALHYDSSPRAGRCDACWEAAQTALARADGERALKSAHRMAQLEFLKTHPVAREVVADHTPFGALLRKLQELGVFDADEAFDALGTPGDILLRGKYVGKLLTDVYQDAPGYVLWLAGRFEYGDEEHNTTRAAHPLRHRALAQELTKGVCNSCFGQIADADEHPWKTHCRSCFGKKRSR